MRIRQELVRKAVHSFGCVAAYVAYMLPAWMVAAVCVVVIAAYSVSEALRCRGRSVPLVTAVTGRCLRRNEESKPALGPIYLALGFMLCFLLFDARLAASAIAMSCVMDAVAGLVGVRRGRTPLPYSPSKTLEGSLAGAASGMIIGIITLRSPWGIGAGLVGAIIESLPLGDLDNIVVPVGVGLFLSLVMHIP